MRNKTFKIIMCGLIVLLSSCTSREIQESGWNTYNEESHVIESTETEIHESNVDTLDESVISNESEIEDWKRAYYEKIDEVTNTYQDAMFHYFFVISDDIPKLCVKIPDISFTVYQYHDDIEEYLTLYSGEYRYASYNECRETIMVKQDEEAGYLYTTYSVSDYDLLEFQCIVLEEDNHYYYLNSDYEKAEELTNSEEIRKWTEEDYDFDYTVTQAKMNAQEIKAAIALLNIEEKNGWQDIYRAFISNPYYENHRDAKYKLCYFDEDDVPELLVGVEDHYSYLYTIRKDRLKVCGILWHPDLESDTHSIAEGENIFYSYMYDRINPMWYCKTYFISEEGLLEEDLDYFCQNEYQGEVGINPETEYMDDNLHFYSRDSFGEVSEISEEEYWTAVDELNNNINMSYIWDEEYSYQEMIDILETANEDTVLDGN